MHPTRLVCSSLRVVISHYRCKQVQKTHLRLWPHGARIVVQSVEDLRRVNSGPDSDGRWWDDVAAAGFAVGVVVWAAGDEKATASCDWLPSTDWRLSDDIGP